MLFWNFCNLNLRFRRNNCLLKSKKNLRTGHKETGKKVVALAAKYMKKFSCELGWNDLFMVLDYANLEEAVKLAV